jgi:hypothetical protein
MRGPKPSHPIALTAEEQEQVRSLVRAHTTGQSLAIRARIVLLAHEHPAWSNQQIAQAIGTSDRLVRKWRQRWTATHSLADAPRCGAPRHFSP